MADRHPVYVEPPEPENPPTEAEAEAAAIAGLDPVWVRRFRQVPGHDGALVYMDVQTGQVYDELPKMHAKDGGDT